MKRLAILAALAFLPIGVFAKDAASSDNETGQFVYLAHTFAIDKSCTDGEAFVVSRNETLISTTVGVLYAFPMPGQSNPTLIGPKDRAASGPLAQVNVGDGMCLTLTPPTS